MEKYAKPQGQGRVPKSGGITGKRKQQTEEEFVQPVQTKKRGSKEEPKAIAFTNRILSKEELRFVAKLQTRPIGPPLWDFVSLFHLIPAFLDLIQSAEVSNASFKPFLPLPMQSMQSPKAELLTRIQLFLEEYPGGFQQLIFTHYPFVLYVGFQKNDAAIKELDNLQSQIKDDLKYNPSFVLFWKTFGHQYNSPIMTSLQLGTLFAENEKAPQMSKEVAMLTGTKLKPSDQKMFELLRTPLKNVFSVEQVFNIPLYRFLTNDRLAGRSIEDIQKQTPFLPTTLSRKLFAKRITGKVKDVCFLFKSKDVQYPTTPSLVFIKNTLANFDNINLMGSNGIHGQIARRLSKLSDLSSFPKINDLEKDCSQFFNSIISNDEWTMKRTEHKNALALFFQYFIAYFMKARQKTFQTPYEMLVERPAMSSGANKGTSGYDGVNLMMAEILITELELRNQGKICFYAARVNTLNGLSILIQEFGQYLAKQALLAQKNGKSTPLIDAFLQDHDVRSKYMSSLVEGNCYRPSLAKGKTALEIITELYVTPFNYDQDLATKINDDLDVLTKEIRSENKEYDNIPRSDEYPAYLVYSKMLTPKSFAWVQVTDSLYSPDESTVETVWYYLISFKQDDEGNIHDISVLETRRNKPSFLVTYKELKSKSTKSRPLKREKQLSDRDPEQADRLRSVNMSLFANIETLAECTFYMLIENYSQTNVQAVFNNVFNHQIFSPELLRDLGWITKEKEIEPAFTALSDFYEQQRKYIGTLLRFSFPCSIVTDYAYAAIPVGLYPASRTISYDPTTSTITSQYDKDFPIDQYIRFLTTPQRWSSESDLKINDTHQARLLDLCYSTIAVKEGAGLDIFKFYPQNMEDDLRKAVRSIIQTLE